MHLISAQQMAAAVSYCRHLSVHLHCPWGLQRTWRWKRSTSVVPALTPGSVPSVRRTYHGFWGVVRKGWFCPWSIPFQRERVRPAQQCHMVEMPEILSTLHTHPNPPASFHAVVGGHRQPLLPPRDEDGDAVAWEVWGCCTASQGSSGSRRSRGKVWPCRSSGSGQSNHLRWRDACPAELRSEGGGVRPPKRTVWEEAVYLYLIGKAEKQSGGHRAQLNAWMGGAAWVFSGPLAAWALEQWEMVAQHWELSSGKKNG